MKAQSLRIGNKFTDNTGFEFTVVGIDKDTILGDFDGNEGGVWEFNISEVVGIPLTEERLTEYGFQKYRNFMGKRILNDWTMIYFNLQRGVIGEISINGHSCVVNCESVHELQNLYYTLVGEELTQ